METGTVDVVVVGAGQAGLRGPGGGIAMEGTRVAVEPRVHLVGCGPSSSTIGANRAGRAAVAEILKLPALQNRVEIPHAAGQAGGIA